MSMTKDEILEYLGEFSNVLNESKTGKWDIRIRYDDEHQLEITIYEV